MTKPSRFAKLGSYRLLAISSLVAAATVATVFAVRARAAGIPASNALVYTGYLETPDGKPRTDEVTIAVSIWGSEGGGDEVCQVEGQTLTPVAGRFQLQLGDECTKAVSTSGDLWLEPVVDGVSLGRSKLGAVPYAVEANHAAKADAASPDGALAKELQGVKEEMAALKARLDFSATSDLTATKNRFDLTATTFTWVSGTKPTKLASGRYWVVNTMRTYKGQSVTSSSSGAYLSVCSRLGGGITVLPSTVISESDGGVSLPTTVVDYVDVAAETDGIELGLCAKQISAALAPTVIAEIHTAVLPLSK